MNNEAVSAPAFYALLVLFLAMTFAMFGIFFTELRELLIQISDAKEVISFKKGALYLLGGSVGIFALLCYASIERRTGPIGKRPIGKYLVYLTMGGAITMFSLPHIAHYGVASYLENSGYSVCEAASRQWLHSRTIVFVSNTGACKRLTHGNAARH